MAKVTKARKAALEKVKPGKAYPAEDALKLVKELAKGKFVESIDVAVNLGVDASRSDQVVRGSTVLPAGNGKKVKVAVFTQGANAEAAKQAAIRGVGVTRLLYYQVVDAVDDGRLAIVLEAFEPKPAPVHLIHAARGQMPLKTRRFLDFATPQLRQALGELGRELPA